MRMTMKLPSFVQQLLKRPTWSKADYALLCRELRMLIQAGMTVVEALEVCVGIGSHESGQPQ